MCSETVSLRFEVSAVLVVNPVLDFLNSASFSVGLIFLFL